MAPSLGLNPPAGGGAPLDPVPMVSSTQTNLSSLPPSKSCHIWKKRWTGIAGIGGVRHVFADLIGAVRQVGGEAGVGNALRQADAVGGVGLRQRRVGAGRSVSAL